MKRGIFITIILLGLVGLFFSGQSLLASKNYLSYQVSGIFRPIANLFQSVFGGSDQLQLSDLMRENEFLKAELLALGKEPFIRKEGGSEFIFAKVYSTYPFNNRSIFSVNAGLQDEVVQKSVVTIGGYILLGQVIDSFEKSSLVRTVFDPGWEIPVKIGDDDTDGLLVGGRKPKLTLVTKDKKVKVGEEVYSASKDFPYGLKIGEIEEVRSDVGNTFQEATLSLFYELKDVTEVLILAK